MMKESSAVSENLNEPGYILGRRIAVLGLLLVFWALAVVSRLLWHGDVYGLNYELFHPDGACYSQMAYDFAGMHAQGVEDISTAYREIGNPIELSADSAGGLQPACNYEGLRARALYPLLSAPFVRTLGMQGMLVVPAASWLLAVLIPVWIGMRSGNVLGPVVAGGLALASVTAARWSVSNTVDPLLMGLVALTLLLLPLSRRTTWIKLVLLATIVVFGSLTKLSFPLWIVLPLAPWGAWWWLHRRDFRRRPFGGNPWNAPLIVMSVTALISWRAFEAILGKQNSPALLNRLTEEIAAAQPLTRATAIEPIGGHHVAGIAVPPQVATVVTEILNPLQRILLDGVKVIGVELGQLWVLDRGLVLLLGLGLLGVWRLRRWPASYIFPAALGILLFMGAMNGTIGVNFRFQLAAIPLSVLMAGLTLSRHSGDDPLEPRLRTSVKGTGSTMGTK